MRPALFTLLTLSTLIVACAGGEKTDATPAGGAATDVKATDVKPTGKIITVLLTTDEKGSYFSPSTIDASPGDVIRFTLKSGVHNVSFPDSINTVKEGLPKSSDFLQIPGQEYDLTVSMPPGTYQFHCDPHAALGMKGTLIVK
ncbi:MAG TPA: plastocyanin/azurin family copper-binding protein [Gemmatimonadaceae bacterium]